VNQITILQAFIDVRNFNSLPTPVLHALGKFSIPV
jgi:hypothetical protein